MNTKACKLRIKQKSTELLEDFGEKVMNWAKLELRVAFERAMTEVYIFESDGVWNQETISHPKLSIEQRLNSSLMNFC